MHTYISSFLSRLAQILNSWFAPRTWHSLRVWQHWENFLKNKVKCSHAQAQLLPILEWFPTLEILSLCFILLDVVQAWGRPGLDIGLKKSCQSERWVPRVWVHAAWWRFSVPRVLQGVSLSSLTVLETRWAPWRQGTRGPHEGCELGSSMDGATRLAVTPLRPGEVSAVGHHVAFSSRKETALHSLKPENKPGRP